jgi:hypothetical protein
MADHNDASIIIRGGIDGSKVVGGEIHTAQNAGFTENKVVITIDKDVTNSAEIIGGKIYVASELKAEIKQMLDQLAQSPTTRNEAVATKAIKQEIKNKPTLKQRLINALKGGGIEALKAIFDHPSISIPVETIKGFLEAG